MIALLVVRTAVYELREPDSGRRQWDFLRDRRALAAGATTALVLGLVGWTAAGTPRLPWAVLAGALVAAVAHGRD